MTEGVPGTMEMGLKEANQRKIGKEETVKYNIGGIKGCQILPLAMQGIPGPHYRIGVSTYIPSRHLELKVLC